MPNASSSERHQDRSPIAAAVSRLLLVLLLLPPSAGAAALRLDISPDAALRDHLFRRVLAMPVGKRPKTGLVLSAGSLRATAHVGVIATLEAAGLPIDVVAGTSMGSIVGAVYAGGHSVGRMRQLAMTVRPTSGSNLGAVSLLRLLLQDKLLDSRATESFIRKELEGRTFDQLRKPFACVAMDLYSGEPIVFREGDVALAVHASMSLPGIFQPVEYRHRYLVDGGVVAYVPVTAARLLGADWVIASIVETDYTRSRPRTVLDSLEQVIDIRGALLSREQRKLADYVIDPPVGDIGMYESNRVQEAINKGQMEAFRRLPGAIESFALAAIDALLAGELPERRP